MVEAFYQTENKHCTIEFGWSISSTILLKWKGIQSLNTQFFSKLYVILYLTQKPHQQNSFLYWVPCSELGLFLVTRHEYTDSISIEHDNVPPSSPQSMTWRISTLPRKAVERVSGLNYIHCLESQNIGCINVFGHPYVLVYYMNQSWTMSKIPTPWHISCAIAHEWSVI